MNKYVFLDGIRGIAAIFVVIWHTEAFWGFRFPHSFLAVDLFFLLSGFVIASAYEEKLSSGKMKFQNFVKTRIIRLYPVYLFSIFLAATALIAKFHYTSFDTFTVKDLMLSASLSVFFIPALVGHSPYLFALNPVYWSLFYELIANFLYALLRPFLSTKVLISIIVSTGSVLAAGAYMKGDLNFGMTWNIESLVGGFTRSVFGMFYGILLYRKKDIIYKTARNSFNFTVSPWFALLVATLILALPIPNAVNLLFEILTIWFLFPILLMIMARKNPARGNRLLLILGAASYPIYVLHEPIADMILIPFEKLATDFSIYSGIILTVFLIIFSVLFEKYIDKPVRRKLVARYLKK